MVTKSTASVLTAAVTLGISKKRRGKITVCNACSNGTVTAQRQVVGKEKFCNSVKNVQFIYACPEVDCSRDAFCLNYS